MEGQRHGEIRLFNPFIFVFEVASVTAWTQLSEDSSHETWASACGFESFIITVPFEFFSSEDSLKVLSSYFGLAGPETHVQTIFCIKYPGLGDVEMTQTLRVHTAFAKDWIQFWHSCELCITPAPGISDASNLCTQELLYTYPHIYI